MNGLMVSLRAELFVSLRSFAAKLIVFGPALLVALQFFLVKLSETGEATRNSLSGSDSFDEAAANNAYGYYVDGLSTGLTMLALLLVGLAAYGFSFERDTGAIRHLLIRRISRINLIAAKLIHLHLLAVLSIILLLSSAYLLSDFLWEFGPIVEDGFELISESEIRFEIALGLELALIPLPAAIAFGLLVSICAQSATQAVTTALGITIAIDIFKGMMGDFAQYVYASFQPSLLDQSYLQDVSRLVRGYSDVLIDDRMVQLNTWVPWPTLFLFIVVSMLLIRQKKM